MKTLAVAAVVFFAVAHGRTRREFKSSEELIEYVNRVQNLWKAGENARFRGVPLTANKHSSLGHVPKPGLKLDIVERSEPIELPDTFDSRTKWEMCPTVKEIRDQGNCGSCFAFSTASALSDRICIHSNGTRTPRLSAEDVLECGNGTCEGGNLGDEYQNWLHKGIVTGGNYTRHSGCKSYKIPPCDHTPLDEFDYNHCSLEKVAPTPSCQKKCDGGYGVSYEKDKHKGAKVYDLGLDPIGIQREIITNGPVSAIFEAFSDFFYYKSEITDWSCKKSKQQWFVPTSGVYRHTAGVYKGYHAIKIIGWGSENDEPYWLVANSYNTEWGDLGGFFKILRGTNECIIESGVVAGIPEQRSW